MRLTAHSLPSHTRTWLHTTHRVRVLHVFARACDLIAADDRVLAIVTPEIGNGPFNVVVPSLDFLQYISLGDPVHVTPECLRIGPLDIDLAAAVEWHPCPDWATLREQQARILARIGVFESVLHDHAPTNSLAQLVVSLPPPESMLERHVLRVVRDHWSVFEQSLRTLDHGMCMSSAARLAGLGNGLTPAGDDWLLGCALAAQIGLPSLRAAELLIDAVQHAATHTSPLSAAWLRAAAEGACSHYWHKLLKCGVGDSARELYHAAEQVVQQGHSSGADALAGFVAVLRLAR